ncbi:antirestriction protein [Caudoviricetes sp.]|nr:antirestriction protein [Caudoviricetes sp.]
MSKIHALVTEKIISQLETGTAPWIKPWNGEESLDHNKITGKAYSGINRLLLGISGSVYNNKEWGTLKQWNALGGRVKRGEHGTDIFYYQPQVAGIDKNTGEEKSYMLLKCYKVFNFEQVEGLQIKPDDHKIKNFVNMESVEDFIIGTGANISHGGNSASFSPVTDSIKLPRKESFFSESNYYATVFHELVHWTGAKSRLSRELSGRFGSTEYAFEELVAELGSAFLCQSFGVQGELRHSGYINSWIKCLKEHNTAIFKAAALAQKAEDYLRSLEPNKNAISA